jgi:hypothetical protein
VGDDWGDEKIREGTGHYIFRGTFGLIFANFKGKARNRVKGFKKKLGKILFGGFVLPSEKQGAAELSPSKALG